MTWAGRITGWLSYLVSAGLLIAFATGAPTMWWAVATMATGAVAWTIQKKAPRPRDAHRRPSGIALKGLHGPFWGALGFALMFFLAARTTGAGWLIVLCCLIVGVTIIGAVVPPFTLMRLTVRASGPADAVAGEPFATTLEVSRPGLGLTAQSPQPGELKAAIVDGTNPLWPMTSERAVIREMVLVISSSAPIGMFSWSRRIIVPFDQPIHVAPRLGTPRETAASDDAVEGELTGNRPAHGDHLRSVREYASGDAMRLVHWPASARRGGLVVKEFESPANPHLHLVVRLHGVPELDERICEDAMATAVLALEERRPVTLHTNDGTAVRVTGVRHRRDAGRALAAAAPGPVPEPDGPDGRIIRLTARGAA